MRIFFSKLTFFGLFACCLSTASIYSQEGTHDYNPVRSFVSYTGSGGIGYRSGYTSYEVFATPCTSWANFQPFIDGRAHWFDRGSHVYRGNGAANLGFGARYLYNENWIVGSNVFYDYRKVCRKNFHQVGFGVEALGCLFDVRANFYFPASGAKRRIQTCVYDFTGGFNARREQYQYSFYGGDLEIGTALLNQFQCIGQYTNLYVAAGPYYYRNNRLHNAVGVRLRLEAELTDFISVEARFTYDHHFGTHVQGVLRAEIPFCELGRFFDRSFGCEECCGICEKFLWRVFRNDIIPTKRDCKWKCNYNCGQSAYYSGSSSSSGSLGSLSSSGNSGFSGSTSSSGDSL